MVSPTRRHTPYGEHRSAPPAPRLVHAFLGLRRVGERKGAAIDRAQTQSPVKRRGVSNGIGLGLNRCLHHPVVSFQGQKGPPLGQDPIGKVPACQLLHMSGQHTLVGGPMETRAQINSAAEIWGGLRRRTPQARSLPWMKAKEIHY